MVMALLTAAFDDVERARAKLRGKPRYTWEELLAQCDQVSVITDKKR